MAALAATFLVLIAAAVAPPTRDDLDLSPGGSTAVQAPAAQPAGPPVWVEDPMTPPLEPTRQP